MSYTPLSETATIRGLNAQITALINRIAVLENAASGGGGSTAGVASYNGRTGVVVPTSADKAGLSLSKADVGLGLADNTADASKNVATAGRWTTARTFSFSGDLSGSASVTGAADVGVPLTLPTVNANVGTYGSATQVPRFTVNEKGQVTAVTLVTITGGGGGTAGVTAFNTRTGDVTLSSADVTGALGYTPTSVTGLTGTQTVAAFKTGLSLVKGDVGLGNVDNTADSAKSVASAATLTTARTIAMSGDVVWSVSFNGSGNVTAVGTIQARAVTASKLFAVSSATILGRATTGSGDVEQLTGTQATSLLDVFTRALKGLVPPSGGTTGTTNFLREDGTWAVPAGGGGGSALREQTLHVFGQGGGGLPGSTIAEYYASVAQTVELTPYVVAGATTQLGYAVASKPTGTAAPSFGTRTVLTSGTAVASVTLALGDTLRVNTTSTSSTDMGYVHVRQTA